MDQESASQRTYEESLRLLERTLVREGGHAWRETILRGELGPVEWPANLPSLTPDLRHWFGWRSEAERPVEWWRSATWAQAEWERLSELPAFRGSLVPILPDTFVHVETGSIWKRDLDPEGLDTFVPHSAKGLTEILEAMEADYASRRRSPWRAVRVKLANQARLEPLSAVPELSEFSSFPVGTALFVAPLIGRWPRGTFLLKHSVDAWHSTTFRSSCPINATCINLSLSFLRADFERGEVDNAALTDPQAFETLSAQMKRFLAKGEVELGRLSLQIWRQPSMSQLLTGLDKQLSQKAPDIRRSLAPPASEAEMAVLEADIRHALPHDFRALSRFANGQSYESPPLYWGNRLMSVTEAASTRVSMLSLAASQFGEAYWDPAFIPFLDRGNADFLCVDTAGAYGPEGAIVDFNHEQPERRRILFDSIHQWLECFVDGLEGGIYAVEEGEGIFPKDFLATGDLFQLREHEEVRTLGMYPWDLELRLRDD